MTKQLFKLKQDIYRTARGGYSRFLNLFCANCDTHILLYQKDGPGPLKRLYCDRIIAPDNLKNLYPTTDLKKLPHLTCKNCETVLAIPYIYEKEERLALLIEENKIKKKLTKGIHPNLL